MKTHDEAPRELLEQVELDRLIADQRRDSTNKQHPERRAMASLDAVTVTSEDGGEITLYDMIAIDPWDAIDDRIAAGFDPTPRTNDDAARPRLSANDKRALHHLIDRRRRAMLTALQLDEPLVEIDVEEARLVLPNLRRTDVWDVDTLVAHGTREAPAHPYSSERGMQFTQAYPNWRRRPESKRVAPPILAKLFACITAAVGVDAARAAASRRGKPRVVDRGTRMITALAVQAFHEMGYTMTSIAAALDLPPRTVQRYADPALLPVLSPEAYKRIFGGTAATSSESGSSPALGLDASRRRSDDPAPASPNHLLDHSTRSAPEYSRTPA